MLTKEKFWEIDKFYSKASSILDEAREHAKKFNHDLCVRRSQEARKLGLGSKPQVLIMLLRDFLEKWEAREDNAEN